MSAAGEIDENLLEFARQVAAIPRRISEEDNARADAHDALVSAAITESPAVLEEIHEPSPAGPAAASTELPGSPVKKQRTSEEIGQVIMTTLRDFGGVPDRGFVITVYGSNPWNALLTIRPEAGSRIDRALWVSRVQDIAARLRSEFDIR
jgi:hypothetical protein